MGDTPRHYTISFDAPTSMVSVLEGRPFRASDPQPLLEWLGDWRAPAAGEAPPHANVKFDRADGSTHSVTIEVLGLVLTPEGKIEADVNFIANEAGGGDLYPSFQFEHAWFITDNQHALPEEGSNGLFTLTGTTTTLTPSAGGEYDYVLTVTDANHISGVAQGDDPSLTRLTVEEVALNWERRFVDSPHASVTISNDGEISGGASVVLQLGPPTVAGDTVTFPATMVSDAGASSSLLSASSFHTRQAGGASESIITLDTVPQEASSKCLTNAHCEPGATCDPSSGACLYATCTPGATPSDCAANTQCVTVESADGQVNLCFPSIGKACTTDIECQASIHVPVICGTDGSGGTEKFCQPRQCPDGETECGPDEQCVASLCYSTPTSISNFPNPEGMLWGGTWSAPARQTVCTQTDARIREFCTHFEQALEDRVVNILDMLFHLSALTGSTTDEYTFFGRNFFAANTQFGVVGQGTSGSFALPSDTIQQALNDPFGIADTSYFNFSSRLAGQLGEAENYEPFGGSLAADATDMLNPFWDSLKGSVTSAGNDPVDTGAPGGGLTPLALKQQYGGGGGYGCYFGLISLTEDSTDFNVEDPILQVGGGFGFGVSESTGLDMGVGAGATACGGTGVVNCALGSNPFIGGGGGKNWRFIAADDPVDNDDTDPPSGYQAAIQKRLSDIEDSDFFYLYCGVGGGLGYQTRPTDLSSPYFASVYGYGGGGNSWVLFRRVADIETGTHDLLEELDIARVSGARRQFLEFLIPESSVGDQSLRFAPDSAEDAQQHRGLLQPNALEKSDVTSVFENENVKGFTYRPYHFEYDQLTPTGLASLVLDSHLADSIYMPGSNAPAELFFTSWDADVPDTTLPFHNRESDALGLFVALNAKSVTYTLSDNPLYFDYTNGTADPSARHQWSDVSDINETILEMLVDQGVEVTLSVPIFVARGNPTETAVPLMVSMNQWAVGEAIRLATVYTNITAVMLGTGRQGVRKGFQSVCNPYNFSTPGAQFSNCSNLESAITFEDYYDLLNYTYGLIDAAITRPLTVGIKQKLELSADATAGWVNPTRIDSSSTTELAMSLLDYWTLELGTLTKKQLEDATGLTKFLFDLTPPANVTLAPMMNSDLVEWAENNKSGTNLGTLPNALTALDDALDDMLTGNTLAGGVSSKGVAAGGILETGWYGTDDLGTSLSTLITSVHTKAPNYDLYINELFDQPWAMLPPTLPGMPTAQCGHTYPIPHLASDNPSGPPMACQLPAECAPNFNVPVPNGGQAQPPCLCLTNNTNYPTWFHPFISDVTSATDSVPKDADGNPLINPLYLPPNSVVTWRRDGDPTINETTFFDVAVSGRDGSFNLGAQWKQWPSQLVGGGCLLWDGTPCAPGAVAGDAVPADVPGELLNGLRCAGVSDAQSGAANANSGMQCPQVWFQFYCEDGAEPNNPICSTSYQSHERRCPNFIFPWQNNANVATNTPLDQWDLQCADTRAAVKDPPAPPLGSCVPEKLGAPQDSTDKGVTGISTDANGCVTVRWVGKGSAAKDVTGWQLKTLQAAVPAPVADFRRASTSAGNVKENLIDFEQTALSIIPADDQVISTADNTVSASYRFCPKATGEAAAAAAADAAAATDWPDLFPFPLGLDTGQYWFRVQPVGGNGALPSVDAIDMEFDPICHASSTSEPGSASGMNATSFSRVGKFTINYPMPEGVLAPPYSLVESVEFTLPPEGSSNATPKTFTITPPVDNGLADFSLPGQPANPTTPVTVTAPYITTLTLNFSGPVGTYGKSNPCVVDLLITAGSDVGDQGGKAAFVVNGVVTARPEAADRCFLETDNSFKFVNGGNFEFCTNITPGDPNPCGALP